MTRKKVCVVMAWGGNSVNLLALAMKSLDNQTEPADQKILISDGFLAPQSIKSSYPSWQFLTNSSPFRGPAETRNYGLAFIQNDIEFILIADADDVSHPDRIKILKDKIEELKLDILGSQGVILSPKFRRPGVRIFPFPKMTNNRKKIRKRLAAKKAPVLSPSVLIRKSLFNSVGLYDSKKLRSEDLDFFIRADKEGMIIGNIPDVLYGYRHSLFSSHKSFKLDYTWSERRKFSFVFYLLHNLKRIWYCFFSPIPRKTRREFESIV